jgi:glycosyltransferase involved in cell wall biosynthesis
LDTSIVCPFFNEEQIIEDALRGLLEKLRELDGTWELILVDDGSIDGSRSVVERIAVEEPRLRLMGYSANRGRGYALRTGLAAARGEIIVTTEIDLSWGTDIVQRLVEAMRSSPSADIVVASPHLPGGGYRNVPAKRVFLSRFGNWVIRRLMPDAVSMNTGMTRAYRRRVIQALPLAEDHKEFHLEVILKATALGYRIQEIPAVLEWREHKRAGQTVRRKSSSRVRRLIVSHTLFSLFANPVRYVLALSAAALALGALSFIGAVVLFALRMTSVYAALMSIALVILGVLLFVLTVILQQGRLIQREIWSLQRTLSIATREREPVDPTERAETAASADP